MRAAGARKSRFAALAGLSGANIAAALISVGTLPYIARRSDPHEFGLAAAVMLVSGLLATVVSGRYEVGAAIADHSDEGHQQSLGLSRLALILAFASTVLLQIGVELWGLTGSASELSVWRWLPLLTLASAGTSVQTLLDTRAGRYGMLSVLITARPVLMVMTVWCASRLGLPVSADVLCVAYLASMAFPSIRAVWLVCRPSASVVRLRQYVVLARRHSRYPRLQVPAALLNALSTSFLAITVGWSFGSAALGAYSLATRLTLLPAAVAGGPINTLYLRESVLVRHESNVARRYYTVAVLGSAVVGILATPVLIIAAPYLPALLGADWANVDEYIFATLPLMGALLVSAPANSALMTYERQRALLGWRILLVGVPVFALVLAGRVSSTPAIGVGIASCVALFLSASYAFFGWLTVGQLPRSGRDLHR